MAVSADEVGKVLVAVVVKGIVSGFGISFGLSLVRFQTGLTSVASRPASCSPIAVTWCRLAEGWDLILVSGSLQGIPSVRPLSVLKVLLSQTFICMVIWSIEVWSVRGLVQRGTCTVIGLQSNTVLSAWIIVICPHSLSEQPVLPKLLPDSEE